MRSVVQRVHGSLLQRSHQAMDTDSPSTMDVTQMPLALREAAFFESADCYTAMIANREVPPLPQCACVLWYYKVQPCRPRCFFCNPVC